MPGGPIVGERLVIVGVPEATTVKEALLETEPAEVVTEINPVVAPVGTVVTIFVAVDETTVADAPLNVTVFWLGVVLKAVPLMVTVAPIGPDTGVKLMKLKVEELCREIETTLPTAS